ncbi:MAG: diaminopimelate epimerase [Desulfovibrionaceae bacterium]|nr:diaminopimelate epimerase [Desulfovibrionaceae bacterium]
MQFTKMHGLGNDYIYISLFTETVNDPAALSRAMSDRHFGIGSDGIVLIGPAGHGVDADFQMQIYNSDGSQAEMCGNAIRCVGKFVYDNALTDKTTLKVETLGGIKILELTVKDNKVASVRVDMGEPGLKPELLPMNAPGDSFIGQEIIADGQSYTATAVSMGNPHLVIPMQGVAELNLPALGPRFEHHPLFPRRTNTEFIENPDMDNIIMRVWERGAGETLACGTGASASLVASVLAGKANRKATVHLLGGDLIVEWDEKTNHVFMDGPATTVFTGTWE